MVIKMSEETVITEPIKGESAGLKIINHDNGVTIAHFNNEEPRLGWVSFQKNKIDEIIKVLKNINR